MFWKIIMGIPLVNKSDTFRNYQVQVIRPDNGGEFVSHLNLVWNNNPYASDHAGRIERSNRIRIMLAVLNEERSNRTIQDMARSDEGFWS
jgi:hypothetical protein